MESSGSYSEEETIAGGVTIIGRTRQGEGGEKGKTAGLDGQMIKENLLP